MYVVINLGNMTGPFGLSVKDAVKSPSLESFYMLKLGVKENGLIYKIALPGGVLFGRPYKN